MQTYSHFLLTAVLKHATKPQSPKSEAALLAGSVASDLPLGLLSLGYIVDRRYIRTHLPDKTRCSPTYNHLYFNNPWWIAAHNSLHAPLPLFALALLGLLLRQRWLLWFVLGAGLHTAVDIFTHANDGPLLHFPLDWKKRFNSPISYWDPQHGGRIFRLLEHLLDGLLIGFLLHKRIKGAE
ncbi:MAG: hypothetical protein DHS20C20_09780 [Ardenticatenaceae bacterium]|nr:MAG: hypothetical protein DHS20C20_09780 [Ardenticatenaceae bacterium]